MDDLATLRAELEKWKAGIGLHHNEACGGFISFNRVDRIIAAIARAEALEASLRRAVNLLKQVGFLDDAEKLTALLAAKPNTHQQREGNVVSETYRIKPLVWVLEPGSIVEHWTADIPGNLIHVARIAGRWEWMFELGSGSTKCDSVEDAKAKAEAYYREQLMQALELVR